MSDYFYGHAPWKSYMSDVEVISIDDGITSVGRGSFRYANAHAVYIADSVTTIGDAAFVECINITELSLPPNLHTIGENAFYKCINLESISIQSDISNWGTGAFSDCTNLKTVTISNDLKSIGPYAFYLCHKIELINFDGHLSDWKKIKIHTGNSSFEKSLLKTACDSSPKEKFFTYTENNSHDRTECCSDCNSVLSSTHEACADDSVDGKCDYCKASYQAYHIAKVPLKNIVGSALDHIPETDFYVEAHIEKKLDAKTASLVIVTYTDAGQMLDIRCMQIDIPNNEKYVYSTKINNPNGNVKKVSVFLLSSLIDFIPLSTVTSFT